MMTSIFEQRIAEKARIEAEFARLRAEFWSIPPRAFMWHVLDAIKFGISRMASGQGRAVFIFGQNPANVFFKLLIKPSTLADFHGKASPTYFNHDQVVA